MEHSVQISPLRCMLTPMPLWWTNDRHDPLRDGRTCYVGSTADRRFACHDGSRPAVPPPRAGSWRMTPAGPRPALPTLLWPPAA